MKKNYTILIFLLITLSFLITSCKDDIIPPKPPDPTPTNDDMYIWESILLNGYLGNVYAADTTAVFINKGYNLLKYDGDTITNISLNDPDFLISNIDGFDRNNIFLGGRLPGGIPTLKKMQNGSVITYQIPNEYGNSISDVFCIGPNEAWLSTTASNNVYRFYFGNFQKYILGDSVYYSYFFKDISGAIYAFGLKVNSYLAPSYSEILITYKLEIDTFNLIRTDTLFSLTGQYKTNNLNRCGSDLMMVGYPILRFNGNNWEDYTGLPPGLSSLPTHIGGTSKDYLILFAVYDYQLHVWNGNWHKEDSFHVSNPILFELTMGPTIQLKDANVYFTVSAPSSSRSYFLIGRRNKNQNIGGLRRLTKY